MDYDIIWNEEEETELETLNDIFNLYEDSINFKKRPKYCKLLIIRKDILTRYPFYSLSPKSTTQIL